MRPFFCYYGGKWRSALSYPAPLHDTVIECFAGAAGYATRHHQKKVLLFETYEKVAALWAYLIAATPKEILSIPAAIEDVDILSVPEQRYLVGFWFNKGAASPCKTPSSWMRSGIRPNSYWGERVRQIIAEQVALIKHWRIHHTSYEQAPDIPATWFIDPPYIGNDGKHYQGGPVDYTQLAGFCRSAKGQVIVCEQKGANWLPFEQHKTIKSNPSKKASGRCHEVIWTNQPTYLF